jgi:hypothetical protein
MARLLLYNMEDIICSKQLVKESIGFNPARDILIFPVDYIDFRPCHVAGHTTHHEGDCNGNKIIIDTGVQAPFSRESLTY